MSLEERNYKLVLKQTARGPVIQFRSSAPQTRESTLIRMGGRKAEEIFNTIVSVLKKYDYITEEGGSDKGYKYYKLKREIGPVVGGYLVLIRRSRNPEQWLPYFEGFIAGPLQGRPRATIPRARHRHRAKQGVPAAGARQDAAAPQGARQHQRRLQGNRQEALGHQEVSPKPSTPFLILVILLAPARSYSHILDLQSRAWRLHHYTRLGTREGSPRLRPAG